MRELYIIRGLPGSGKSTFAKKIAEIVCEADNYFSRNGKYEYNREELGQAHQYCKDNVKAAMEVGYGPIAVANTFSKRWEMQDYFDLAFRYGYTVTEVTMSGPMHKNTHEVPQETVDRMKYNWDV